MDEAVTFFRTGIEDSEIKREEKLRAFKRLRSCVPEVREVRG